MALTTVIRIIGAIIAIQGAVFMARPQWVKGVFNFVSRGRLLYIPAILKGALGVVFLVAALECTWPLVIIVLGILFCMSGVCAFVIKLEKLKAMLQWWCARSETALRLLLALNIIIGGIILFAA